MKLTQEQANEFADGWWKDDGGSWQEFRKFVQNYDFPLPDHGWTRYIDRLPTEEDGDAHGNVVVFHNGGNLDRIQWHIQLTGMAAYWTRSPRWKPKPPDPFDGFLSKIPDELRNDETAMSVIKTAYKLGQSNPNESQPS